MSFDAGAEDDAVAWGEVGVDLVVAVAVDDDQESFEEGLVQESTDLLGCVLVGAAGVFSEVECQGDELLGVVEVSVERFELLGDLHEF